MNQSILALKAFLQQQMALDDSSWQQLLPTLGYCHLHKGQTLLAAGQTLGKFWFVNQGLLRNVYRSEQGKEFNKSFIAAPGLCGASRELINGEASRFSIEAIEECHLVALPITTIKRWCQQDKHWQQFYIQQLEQLLLKKEQREAQFLLDDATSRYLTFVSQFPQLATRLPAYHIAAYLGISEVALSRIKRQLKTQNRA